MVAKKVDATPATKTYVLKLKDDSVKKVTVPASWKVTFGALVPGSKDHNGSTTALRFYEGKDQQRACFVGVVEFRDSSLEVLDRIEDVQTEIIEKADGEGNMKNYTVEARETKWVNPDQPKSSNNALKPSLLKDLRSVN